MKFSKRVGKNIAKLNRWCALRITKAVGTMWCAYAFMALACISLPSALSSHNLITIVSWIAQTFLQLVLLAVIQTGQNIMAEKQDKIIHRMEKLLKGIDAKESQEIEQLKDYDDEK